MKLAVDALLFILAGANDDYAVLLFVLEGEATALLGLGASRLDPKAHIWSVLLHPHGSADE